jgi:hypothetical protein
MLNVGTDRVFVAHSGTDPKSMSAGSVAARKPRTPYKTAMLTSGVSLIVPGKVLLPVRTGRNENGDTCMVSLAPGWSVEDSGAI